MNFTPITTPKVVKLLYPNLIWEMPVDNKAVYLTFDDGPTPEITNWVLEILKKFNAKATFFCIGKNVAKHPKVFQQIIKEGHGIGNHTFNHLKGWKIKTKKYIENTNLCEKTFETQNLKNNKLFRPPYGQVSPKQIKKLRKLDYKIVMWSTLSVDWDKSTTKETCFNNVINNSGSGSIIVFHDSIKASTNMKYALPKVLEYYAEKGYAFKRIPE